MRVITTDKTFAVVALMVQRKAVSLADVSEAMSTIARGNESLYECGDPGLVLLLRGWRALRTASDEASRAHVKAEPSACALQLPIDADP